MAEHLPAHPNIARELDLARSRGAMPPPPPPADYAEPQGIQLHEVLSVLRRHALLIAFIPLACGALAAYRSYRSPDRYQAEAQVRLAGERMALTAGIEGPMSGQALGPRVDPLRSQIEIMRSRGVVGEVVRREGFRLQIPQDELPASYLGDVQIPSEVRLDSVFLEFGETGVTASVAGDTQSAAYAQPLEVGGARFTVLRRPPVEETVLRILSEEAAIRMIEENFTARPIEMTDLIELTFTSTDPDKAQRVLNALVASFQASNASAAQEQTRRRRVFLEQRLQETDAELAEAHQALANFRGREQLYSSRDRFAGEQAGLLQLDFRRGELESDQQMFQNLLNGLVQSRSGEVGRSVRTLISAPGIASNPVVTQLYTQLVQYETARDTLVTGEWSSAATNPDVQKLNTLISSTEAKLVAAVRSYIRALDARITSLDDLKNRNAADIQRLPEIETEEQRLALNVETVRRVADQLRDDYQKARIAEAVEAGDVQIVDLAVLPRRPIGSGRTSRILIGLVLGLMLGSGAAFAVEQMNSSIRHKGDVEAVLGTPILGVIPQIGKAPNQTRRLALPFRTGKGVAKSGDQELGSLVTVSDFRSSGAEAYRTLRTNLIFSQSLGALRSIVVTSASASEGKTTTAANLAVTFAQQGMRVLILDCDLRRPRLHTLFNIPKEPGLTQMALGHRAAAELIRGTQIEGLFVLPCGTQPPNPSELLGGAPMRDALDTLIQMFDLVVIDTPPLLAATDAAILGKVADGVLLVVRAGQTERAAAQQAREQLAVVGARMLGAVLNDPDAKMPRYGYAGYNYYQYNYYGSEE